jgi:hypothetical protein
VAALSGAAERTMAVAAGAADRAQRVLAADHETGPQRVALVRRLGALAGDTERALRGLDLGPDRGLVGRLAHARVRFDGELRRARNGLTRAEAASAAMAALLDGPRRTLVLAANNAEMRAGSGMFLSAGVLETVNGRLKLSAFHPTGDRTLPPDAVPLTGDMAARWGWLHPNQEWRNLGASPRFDTTAPLAAAMWSAATGEAPVDSVIAVDPPALAAVLHAVGPVTVDTTRLTGNTVVDFLMHDQYLRFAGTPDQAARRDVLGAVAGLVLGALDGRSWDVGEMASGITDAAAGRHLLAWSRQPSEQRQWERAGVAGAVASDSLLVAVLNRGGNKLDRFLQVSAALEMTSADGASDGVLRLRLHNTTPAGEPVYVAGPNPFAPTTAGEYLGLVTVTLPGATTSAVIDGHEHLAVAGRDGPTQVVGTEVRIAPGATVELVVRFGLAGAARSLWVEPSARVPAGLWAGEKSRSLRGFGREVQW